VARVSAGRSLLTTKHMLTGFPIQTLSDAPAMVEFSRFPGSPATAAEIDENLEIAVRAAAEPDRGAIFGASNRLMVRLGTSVVRQLSDLRKALRFDPSETATARAAGERG
jgi:hypothetical protein